MNTYSACVPYVKFSRLKEISVLGIWLSFFFMVVFSNALQAQADTSVTAQTVQVLKAPAEPVIIPGRLIIKFKPTAELRATQSVMQELNLTTIQSVSELNIVTVKIPAGKTIEQVIEECKQYSQVEYAEPDYKLFALEIPNDPDFSKLWGLHNTGQTGGKSDADIDAPEAWDMEKGKQDILVAIIDTGIDYNHPDLKDNIWRNPGEIPGNNRDDDNNGFVDDVYGWDFANNDADPFDDNLHGTHVAGTIGAVGNNNRGVVGVNWRVSLMALKFLTTDGSGSTSDAIKAITYGAKMGVQIMNNSWGGGGFSQALKDAIVFARDRGVLFVAAAGNESRDTDKDPNYPSNYDVENVISVAASTSRDELAIFSNYGATTVDFAAPGENIYSTVPGNSYRSLNGTSMATPHVAGAAALVWAHFSPINDFRMVKYRMMGGVDFISGFQNQLLFEGRLNVKNALSSKPLIALFQRPADTDNIQGPYLVKGGIVDDGTLQSVLLFYEMSGATSRTDSMVMDSEGNHVFKANIPGAPMKTDIRYRVKAVDNEQNVTWSRWYTFKIAEAAKPPGGCWGGFPFKLSLNGVGERTQNAVNLFLNIIVFFGPPISFKLFRRKKVKR